MEHSMISFYWVTAIPGSSLGVIREWELNAPWGLNAPRVWDYSRGRFTPGVFPVPGHLVPGIAVTRFY